MKISLDTVFMLIVLVGVGGLIATAILVVDTLAMVVK